VASTRQRPAAAQSFQLQQTQYLGEAIETSGTAATSLKLLIPATISWATTPRQFPSAATIPTQSTIQRVQPHPAHAIAQPACAGVRSESPTSCRKNELEICRFVWNWRPQRPPASPPATSDLSRALPSPRHHLPPRPAG
jgi:hypothetical protein